MTLKKLKKIRKKQYTNMKLAIRQDNNLLCEFIQKGIDNIEHAIWIKNLKKNRRVF